MGQEEKSIMNQMPRGVLRVVAFSGSVFRKLGSTDEGGRMGECWKVEKEGEERKGCLQDRLFSHNIQFPIPPINYVNSPLPPPEILASEVLPSLM